MPEPGLERSLHGRGGAAVGVAGGGDQRRLERLQLFWHDGVSHSPAAGAERTNSVEDICTRQKVQANLLNLENPVVTMVPSGYTFAMLTWSPAKLRREYISSESTMTLFFRHTETNASNSSLV